MNHPAVERYLELKRLGALAADLNVPAAWLAGDLPTLRALQAVSAAWHAAANSRGASER